MVVDRWISTTLLRVALLVIATGCVSLPTAPLPPDVKIRTATAEEIKANPNARFIGMWEGQFLDEDMVLVVEDVYDDVAFVVNAYSGDQQRPPAKPRWIRRQARFVGGELVITYVHRLAGTPTTVTYRLDGERLVWRMDTGAFRPEFAFLYRVKR